MKIYTGIFCFLSISILLMGGNINTTTTHAAYEQVQLLSNGDFEMFMGSWTPTNAQQVSSINGRTGQALSWQANGIAGIYQQVPLTPGTTVRLSAWTKGDGSSDVWLRQRVGISPDGSTDPNDPDIIWSLPGQFTSEWGQLVVEAEVAGEYATVFLTGNPDSKVSTISYDDATLYTIAYPIAVAPPLPAPTVDPLVIGLVGGVGVSPGTQGYRIADNPSQNLAVGNPSSVSFLLLLVVLLAIVVLSLSLIRARWGKKRGV